MIFTNNNPILGLLLVVYAIHSQSIPLEKLNSTTSIAHNGTISNTTEPIHHRSGAKIPPRFDAREKWPFCNTISNIKYQGSDDSTCWAFAATGVMSDRLCISTKGEQNVDISTLDLLECCPFCQNSEDINSSGYIGGVLERAFNWLETFGSVTGERGCKPLDRETGKTSKGCREHCTNTLYEVPYAKDKILGGTTLILQMENAKDIESVQREIMTFGPIVALFDYYGYLREVEPGTVLVFNENLQTEHDEIKSHAVRLIGWDVKEDGTPVWVFANSWGDEWCDDGFCTIRRGTNELNIEAYPMVFARFLKKDRKVGDEQDNTMDEYKRSKNTSSSHTFYLFKILLVDLFVIMDLKRFL